MSRIGKQPVNVPKGVQASVAGNMISAQGPKGNLKFELGQGVAAKVEGSVVTFSLIEGSTGSQAKANWGTAKAIVENMLLGVGQGWSKSLELQGVGYNASVVKNQLKLSVGLSHDVFMNIPAGVICKVDKNTTVILESADKQLIGNFAAKIRKVRPPEPYLGKGIRITGEKVRRKAGKAGKK